jgi:hypothetical protein
VEWGHLSPSIPPIALGWDRWERNCRRQGVRSEVVCGKRVTVAGNAKEKCEGHRPVGEKGGEAAAGDSAATTVCDETEQDTGTVLD